MDTPENGERTSLLGSAGGGAGSKPRAANSWDSPRSEDTPSGSSPSKDGPRPRVSSATVASSSSESGGGGGCAVLRGLRASGTGSGEGAACGIEETLALGYAPELLPEEAALPEAAALAPLPAPGGGMVAVPCTGTPSGPVRSTITLAHFLQRTFTPRGPILSSAIMY